LKKSGYDTEFDRLCENPTFWIFASSNLLFFLNSIFGKPTFHTDHLPQNGGKVSYGSRTESFVGGLH